MARPASGRIAGHLQLLAILWVTVGAFRLIPALIVFVVSAAPVLPPGVPDFVRGILQAVVGLLAIGSVVSIVTGVALLARQSWARMLAIVFGCLNLMDIPFGTAIGIYTLWVLLPEESEKEYERIAQA